MFRFTTRREGHRFGGRVIGQGNPSLNSAETRAFVKGRTLYGLNWYKHAIRRADRVILVEGYFDCVRLMMAGLMRLWPPLGRRSRSRKPSYSPLRRTCSFSTTATRPDSRPPSAPVSNCWRRDGGASRDPAGWRGPRFVRSSQRQKGTRVTRGRRARSARAQNPAPRARRVFPPISSGKSEGDRSIAHDLASGVRSA